MPDKIAQRIFVFNSAAVQSNCIMLARNLPVDGSVEIVIRKASKIRTPDQSAAMWAGPLRDIEEQAWVKGRQFKADVWHEHFKREFLPEGDEEDFDRLVKLGYRKWDYTPQGDRVLVGSTTQLTMRGMGQYMEKLTAYGASELGVQFHASPKQAQGIEE